MLGRNVCTDPESCVCYLYFSSWLHMIFSGITFKGTHGLEQHTDFRSCPSMLLISLDYHHRVFYTRVPSLHCSTWDLVHFLPKCELLRICAVYLGIYMLANHASCDSNTRSETTKLNQRRWSAMIGDIMTANAFWQ